jgi:hypothetical protein
MLNSVFFLACGPVFKVLGSNKQMFSSIRFFRFTGLVIVFSSLAVAQEPACLDRTIPLNVEDESHARIQNLSLSDFKGEFHGTPVHMVSLTPGVEPRRIRILLDTSSSMLGEYSGKWTVAQRVAQDIVREFPERYQISFMTFSSGIELSLDSVDRTVLISKLQELAVSRKALDKGLRHTALFDSIYEAIKRDSILQSGDALYVITDGGDNRSQERIRVIENELLSKGIRLFAFIFIDWSGSRSRVVSEGEGGPDELATMVRETGGYAVMLRPDPRSVSAGRLDPDYRRVLDDLSRLDRLLQNQFRQMAFYDLLRISLPETVDKLRTWKLTRVVPKDSPYKEISVYYPQKLLPCDTTAQSAPVHRP